MNYDVSGQISSFDAYLSGLSLMKGGRQVVNNANIIMSVDLVNNDINFKELDGELSQGSLNIRQEELANHKEIKIIIENSNVENVRELFSLENENKIGEEKS